MDELKNLAIAHHLYIIAPMIVGVWLLINWSGWKERFELWQLRRSLERQRRSYADQKAAGTVSQIQRRPAPRQERPPAEGNRHRS